MPTLPRNIFPNCLYHVFNRSIEKRTMFYNEKYYNKFLEKIIYYEDVTNVEILSYAILPNHFHFLLKEPDIDHQTGEIPIISKFISLLSNSYTKYFNNRQNRSGNLFQGPFKSKIIGDDAYLQSIVAYINLNPIKHKIVSNIDDWEYTSHHELMEKMSRKIINNNDFFNISDYKDIIRENVNKIRKMRLEFD